MSYISVELHFSVARNQESNYRTPSSYYLGFMPSLSEYLLVGKEIKPDFHSVHKVYFKKGFKVLSTLYVFYQIVCNGKFTW